MCDLVNEVMYTVMLFEASLTRVYLALYCHGVYKTIYRFLTHLTSAVTLFGCPAILPILFILVVMKISRFYLSIFVLVSWVSSCLYSALNLVFC